MIKLLLVCQHDCLFDFTTKTSIVFTIGFEFNLNFSDFEVAKVTYCKVVNDELGYRE